MSGLMVVGGIALTATGAGSWLGGALIAAGANSIIGAYTNEAAGGSTTAGWVGGAISGGISGVGAGKAGNLLVTASGECGLSCLKAICAAGATAFSYGAAGSLVGSGVVSIVDKTPYDFFENAISAAGNGVVNMVSAFGSSMCTMLTMTKAGSRVAAGIAAAVTAIITETVCDTFTYVIGSVGSRSATSRWKMDLY